MLISTITSILLYFFIRNTLTDSYFDTLTSEAITLLDEVEIDPIQIPISDVDQWVYAYYQNEFEIEELYIKPGFPNIETLLDDFAFFDSASDSSDVHNNLLKDSISLVRVYKPAYDLNEGSIHLIMAKSNSTYLSQLSQVKWLLFLGNALTILLSLTISYSLAGYSLKPVQTIIAKAKGIKAGTNMDRLPIENSQDEIADLSETINDMISRIERTIIEQNRFFASAAHELRTPLANMQSELEYRMLNPSADDYKEFLISARDEVIRLKSVVQDFLLMSQLKQDKLELKKQSLRLDDLVYDTLEKVRPDLRRAGFEVKLSLAKDLERKDFDHGKIESLLVNLLDNARRYGDTAEPITIYLENKEGHIELLVSNKINPNVKEQGNGIGLWICQRIADLHSFSFKTESTDVFYSARLVC